MSISRQVAADLERLPFVSPHALGDLGLVLDVRMRAMAIRPVAVAREQRLRVGSDVELKHARLQAAGETAPPR